MLNEEEFRFHHLGVACENINAEAEAWQVIGYKPETDVFVDETQGIRGRFYVGNGPRLELLEAVGDSKTLAPWIKRSVKIYHSGYIVRDIDASIARLEAQGAIITRPPLLSTYFGTRIAFLMLPNMALIELINAQNSDQDQTS